ncbi:MAG: hypothetical protein PWQ73_155 [Petrotoga sp.]|nr:hypothetical protein [Petrotoga sp.]
MLRKNLKIIHIMNHPPAYEQYSDKPRPEINWDTQDGSWVGIWGYDWADQIANECLKISYEFEHEVWQPDLRADKIYSHTFENGLTHRMFPAIVNSKGEIISPLMLSFLNEEDLKRQIIFHLSYPHFIGLNRQIIDTYGNHKFVLTFNGEINLPYNGIFRIQKNPFRKLYYLKEHFLAKKYFNFFGYVTYPSDRNINVLKKYYKGKLAKLTMGVNTSKFKFIDKQTCRQNLKIPFEKKVILSVSRLYDMKQVDRLIEILNEIDLDFLFIIVGHGTRQYEKYLFDKAKPLLDKNKIRFEGYKKSDELVKYYNAADIFIHVSKSEAGPVSVMEAMACGLPVFCTDTGNTAEVLKENNSGAVVGIKNYKQWKRKLIEFLNGKPIKALDLDIVKKHYDWKNIAEKLIKIYKEVLYGI